MLADSTTMNYIDSHLDNVAALDVETIRKKDDGGYTLLMHAAERGREDAVKTIIERLKTGELNSLNVKELDYAVDGKTAASLAFANGHYGIVLELLLANAKIPDNYTNIEDPGNMALKSLKDFLAISIGMHKDILKVSERNMNEKIKDFIHKFGRYHTVKYFYDLQNNSLVKNIILHKRIFMLKDIFNYVTLGHYESFSSITEDPKILEELHLISKESSLTVFKNYLLVIMANCRFVADNQNDVDIKNKYERKVSEVLEFLSKLPNVRIILKAIAVTKNFSIYFDFNRQCVDFCVPYIKSKTTNGFYLPKGNEIYIAAEGLFDKQFVDTCSVIAHELCHFAMQLVYKNNCKPYKPNDKEREEKFKKIYIESNRESQKPNDVERVIFFASQGANQHSEMIVRVPHLSVLYIYDTEKLKKTRERFSPLFDYYENVVMKDMNSFLLKLERANDFKSYVKKIFTFPNVIMAIALLFSLNIYISHDSNNYAWSSINSNQKDKFNNVMVTYKGTYLKFGELFANDSKVYPLLSTDHIKDGLNGNSSALSKAIEMYFEPHVLFTYSNMTDSLRDKVKSSKVIFQGAEIILGEVSNDLSNLSVAEIKNILDGKIMRIGKPIENMTKFYVERYFVEENIQVNVDFYKNEEIFEGHPNVKNFKDILKECEKFQIFLLSSYAGDGKSATLNNFALRLKAERPAYWIQFVDLKQYLKEFRNGRSINLNELEKLVNFLTFDLLKLKDFESRVFMELFNKGRVIFLWDGLDEISPNFKDFIMNLVDRVKTLSFNLQFLSTRPQYSKDLHIKFAIKRYKLVSFGKSERIQFTVKFMACEYFNLDPNVFWGLYNKGLECKRDGKCEDKYIAEMEETTSRKISANIKKCITILEQLEASKSKENLFTNPILLQMIAEIVNDLERPLNLQQIFDHYIKKKLKIIDEKGEIVKEVLRKPWFGPNPSVSIELIHQIYALKVVFKNDMEIFLIKNGINLNDLEFSKNIKKVSAQEISRYGILHVDTNSVESEEENIFFAHRSFAESLAATYLFQNIDKINMKGNRNDSLVNVYFLALTMFDDKFLVVKEFFLNHIRSTASNSEIHQLLNKTDKISDIIANENVLKMINYASLNHFLLSAHEVDLKKFLTINSSPTDIEAFTNIMDTLSKKLDNLTFLGTLEDILYNGCELFTGKNLKKLKNLLDKIMSVLDKSQIYLILTRQDLDGKNVLMEYAQGCNSEIINVFIDFINVNLEESEQEKLLLLEHKSELTSLQFATLNKDANSFYSIQKMYRKVLSTVKISKILLKWNRNTPPFTFVMIEQASVPTVNSVIDFIGYIFKGTNIENRTQVKELFEYDYSEFKIQDGDIKLKYEKIKELSKKLLDISNDAKQSTETKPTNILNNFITLIVMSTILGLMIMVAPKVVQYLNT